MGDESGEAKVGQGRQWNGDFQRWYLVGADGDVNEQSVKR